MNEAAHEAINLGNVPLEGPDIGDFPSRYTTISQQELNFGDGSGPLFSMYIERAEEEDKKMAESWKADADGILVFTGLFSAAIASLVSVSVQDLRPNSQDISAFYLANIYKLMATAAANGSQLSIPPTLASPPPFSPPRYAIWVNSLWFLSLAMSLTCALLATLLHQWARRYIKITRPRYSPHNRARIRAFFAEGVEHLHLPWAVEALPTLLHLSLFLFFAGLLVFLFNIHHTVFSFVAWWIGICAAVYACVTLMPMLRHDSPYYAPLSSTAWSVGTGVLFVFFRVLQWVTHSRNFDSATWRRCRDAKEGFLALFTEGMEKIVERSARTLSSGIDGRALMWTFDSLDEDSELERFFGGITGFCSSEVVEDPLNAFIKPNEERLSWALVGLIDRTSSSSWVPKPVKRQRIEICVRAMDMASFPIDAQFLGRVLSEGWAELLSSIEFGLLSRKRVDHSDPLAVHYSQLVISVIIARVQERDDRWFQLVTGQLHLSGSVLRKYLTHGDSVSLANLIHITRHIIEFFSSQHEWSRRANARSTTLESVSKFDVRHTLPRVQHEFCGLWNELTRMAQNTLNRRMRLVSINILRNIRNIFISLHENTDVDPTLFSASTDINDPVLDDPSSYPSCTIEGHRPTAPPSASRIRDAKEDVNPSPTIVYVPPRNDTIRRTVGSPPSWPEPRVVLRDYNPATPRPLVTITQSSRHATRATLANNLTHGITHLAAALPVIDSSPRSIKGLSKLPSPPLAVTRHSGEEYPSSTT
ncbi:hypothetical protein BC827DRAFT_1269669 [Russula dissimulans]|nr:hypothetical protein BC827DRAFT_1269669 [Russula dissimulans]